MTGAGAVMVTSKVPVATQPVPAPVAVTFRVRVPGPPVTSKLMARALALEVMAPLPVRISHA